MHKQSNGDWHQLSANQYILPPQRPENLPIDYNSGRAFNIDPNGGWRSPLFWGGIITTLIVAGGSIIVALINHKSDAASVASSDSCADSKAHFEAAIALRDINLKRQRLGDLISRFQQCGSKSFYEDAVYALADLNKQARIVTKKISPPIETGVVEIGATQLPPLVVTIDKPSLLIELGATTVLRPGIYRVKPPISATVSISVLDGTVILIIDGVSRLECVGGNSFRIFTRGYSTYDVLITHYNAQIQITGIQRGNSTGYSNCTAPPEL